MTIEQASDLILTHAASPIRMSQFRREFLALYEPPMAARSTRNKYRQVLDLVEGLGVVSTDQITPELVARFIAARPPGQSSYTTRSLLMSLRAIANYAEGRRYVVISPFRLRKLSRWVRVAPPKGKRHQSREEIRRILQVLAGDVATKRGWAGWRARRLHAAACTVAYAGLRFREAFMLWAEDVDPAAGLIRLVPRGRRLPDPGVEPVAGDEPRLKTEASAQPICLPAALGPILTDWMAHRHDHPADFALPPLDRIPWLFPGSRRVGPWIDGAPGTKPIDRLKAAARRAGVEGVTWQSLRRSWATIAEGLGIPQAMITRQCRHTSEDTTKRWYQQRDLGNLRDAVGGFDL